MCHLKVRKRWYVPAAHTNGCTMVPDYDLSLISLYNFQTACDNHDICYQDCSRTQAQCDAVYRQDLRNECETMWRSAGSPWWNPLMVSRYQSCLAQAELYYNGVSTLGRSFWDTSQVLACDEYDVPCGAGNRLEINSFTLSGESVRNGGALRAQWKVYAVAGTDVNCTLTSDAPRWLHTFYFNQPYQTGSMDIYFDFRGRLDSQGRSTENLMLSCNDSMGGNVSASRAINIEIQPFRIAQFQAPVSVQAGETISLSWQVQAVDSVSTRCTLSTDSYGYVLQESLLSQCELFL